MCIDPHQTGFVGKSSDHVQLIKFWPSRAPGRGSAAGPKILAPPYYSQRTVFASPQRFFIISLARSVRDEREREREREQQVEEVKC